MPAPAASTRPRGSSPAPRAGSSHAGVDRRGTILPLGAPEDVEKISPVEASWRLLEHLTEVWDARFASADPALALAQQEVILTVPASFDAAARDLTVEAASAAGFENLTPSKSRKPRSTPGRSRAEIAGAKR